ncbi:hypothetical protein [Roseomonas sp. WA12]
MSRGLNEAGAVIPPDNPAASGSSKLAVGQIDDAGYTVSDFGDAPHPSSTETGAKLFIVD